MSVTVDAALEQALREQFAGMSRDELLAHAQQLRKLEDRLTLSGPQTDDELHAWIKLNLGIDIPQVKVCDEHCSPFDFIADIYFQRTANAMGVANRSGGKTQGAAVLHYLRGRFFPGVETMSLGAVEQQSRRAYAHLQRFLDKPVSEGLVDQAKRTQQETRWRNGSITSVVPGTVSQVNGPHPAMMHADEVELMDPEVFEESQNCPATYHMNPDTTVAAQYIITSTRKRAFGPMAQLVKQVQDAVAAGLEPPWDVYFWCIAETAKQVTNCKAALGDSLAEGEGCPCNDIVNGEWDNGDPRSLESCCRGRFHQSRGYIPLSDIIRTFTSVSRTVWEAQNECLRPSTQDLVLPEMTRERYGLINYMPDPDLGPIVCVWDAGGTNPHAVEWYHYLRYDVDAETPGGKTIRLKADSRVAFDEIYVAETGNTEVGKKVLRREAAWRERIPNFKVTLRIADIRAKAARMDWIQLDPELRTIFVGTFDVKEQIDHLRDDIVAHKKMWADINRCPAFWEEVQMWHYPGKKAGLLDDPEKPVEDADHAMSTLRYFNSNMKAILRKKGGDALPHAGTQAYGMAHSELALPQAGPRSRNSDQRFASEQWRENLGGPPVPGMGRL